MQANIAVGQAARCSGGFLFSPQPFLGVLVK